MWKFFIFYRNSSIYIKNCHTILHLDLLSEQIVINKLLYFSKLCFCNWFGDFSDSTTLIYFWLLIRVIRTLIWIKLINTNEKIVLNKWFLKILKLPDSDIDQWRFRVGRILSEDDSYLSRIQSELQLQIAETENQNSNFDRTHFLKRFNFN